MSQASISSYYHPRKRGIDEDIAVNKRKVIRLDDDSHTAPDSFESTDNFPVNSSETESNGKKLSKKDAVVSKVATRQVLTPQRSTRSRAKQMQNVDGIETQKLVNFWIGGSLSPKKKSKQPPSETVISKDAPPAEISIQERPGMTTPVKSQPEVEQVEKAKTRKPLNLDEIKNKLKNSSRITELKTSLNKLQSGLDRLQNIRNEREGKGPVKEKKDDDITPKQLKPFKSIEFQILR